LSLHIRPCGQPLWSPLSKTLWCLSPFPSHIYISWCTSSKCNQVWGREVLWHRLPRSIKAGPQDHRPHTIVPAHCRYHPIYSACIVVDESAASAADDGSAAAAAVCCYGSSTAATATTTTATADAAAATSSTDWSVLFMYLTSFALHSVHVSGCIRQRVTWCMWLWGHRNRNSFGWMLFLIPLTHTGDSRNWTEVHWVWVCCLGHWTLMLHQITAIFVFCFTGI